MLPKENEYQMYYDDISDIILLELPNLELLSFELFKRAYDAKIQHITKCLKSVNIRNKKVDYPTNRREAKVEMIAP